MVNPAMANPASLIASSVCVYLLVYFDLVISEIWQISSQ